MRAALGLSLVLACACQRKPAPIDSPSPTPTTPIAARCTGRSRPLAVAPLTLAWQQDQRPISLNLASDGTIRHNDAVVARVNGACIIDPHANVLRAVDPNDVVTDGHGQKIATFQRRPDLRDDEGNTIRTTEVLTTTDGTATAVTDDGNVYVVPPNQPAFPLPANAEGAVPRARRAALLLFELGPKLEHAAD